MGAVLPANIPLDAPRGEPLPTIPDRKPFDTDLGLSSVAQSLAGAAEDRQKTLATLADRKAEDLVTGIRTQFQPQMAEAAASYTADSPPGFAQDQLGKLDDTAQAALAQQTDPFVRRALLSKISALKAEVGANAVTIEASKRAAPIAAQQAALDDAAIGKGWAAYNAQFGAARTQIEQANVDGHDMAAQELAAHDQAAAAGREQVIPRLQGEWDQHMAAQRVDLEAKAQGAQGARNEAYLTDQALNQGRQLANATGADPSSYGANKTALEAVIGTLPAYLQPKYREELGGQLAESRLNGLIDAGREDTSKLAVAEAAIGDPDSIKALPPGAADRLNARIETIKLRHAQEDGNSNAWARHDSEQALDAASDSLAMTGNDFGYDPAKDPALSDKERAAASAKMDDARAAFQQYGDLSKRPVAEVEAIAGSQPPNAKLADGSQDPDYGRKYAVWQYGVKAAQNELAGLAKNGQAAGVMRSTQAGDVGDQANQAFAGLMKGDPAQTARYVSLQLSTQDRRGVGVGGLQVFAPAQAQQLAKGYLGAQPQAKGDMLVGLARAVTGAPATYGLANGAKVAPRQLMLSELKTAGLKDADIAALTSLGDNENALRAYAAAAADPKAGQKLPGENDERTLQQTLAAQLRPYNATVMAQPGGAALAAGNGAWASAVARHLILTQGMSPQQAAVAAVAPLTGLYRFDGQMRVPRQVADQQPGVWGAPNGLDLIRDGGGLAVRDLTANGGAMLYGGKDPNQPGLTSAQIQANRADVVSRLGRWVTNGDDAGATLVTPNKAGGWDPVRDRWGRTVSLPWSGLQGRTGMKPGDILAPLDSNAPALKGWLKPPPPALPAPPANHPLAANPASEREYSNAEKFHALSAALAVQEDPSGDPNARSPKGARGQYQLMPETAQEEAQRMGVAYNPGMLTDPVWNKRLGEAALHRSLVLAHGNVPMALAAYNAGPGRVFGMTDKATGRWAPGWVQTIGDPRTGRITPEDWVAHVPFAETRDYLRRVIPHAAQLLRANN